MRPSPSTYIPLLFLPSCIAASDKTVIITITATATATATRTTTETTPPRVGQDPSYISSTLFESSILRTTNTYRTAHNAAGLIWNDTLASYAREWAETCAWEHSHGPYGENLAYGYANATAAVEAWGDEVRMYDFNKPTGFTEETGHFTQLVWRATREVGCAAVDCGITDWGSDDDEESDGGVKRAQGWYVVCEYVPGGNVVGGNNRWFRENVLEGSGDEDEDDDDEQNDENENEDEDEDEDEDDRSDLAWLFKGQGSRESRARRLEWVIWWAGTACLLNIV